MTANTA